MESWPERRDKTGQSVPGPGRPPDGRLSARRPGDARALYGVLLAGGGPSVPPCSPLCALTHAHPASQPSVPGGGATRVHTPDSLLPWPPFGSGSVFAGGLADPLCALMTRSSCVFLETRRLPRAPADPTTPSSLYPGLLWLHQQPAGSGPP